jgi:hypothetical protein
MSDPLALLVAMLAIWPQGPGPKLFKTELHLRKAIDEQLSQTMLVKLWLEVGYG